GQGAFAGRQRLAGRRPRLLPERADGAGVRQGVVRAEAGPDQRRRHHAVRLPRDQGRRSQGRARRPLRGSAGEDQGIPDHAEEDAASRRLHPGPEEESEDRGAGLNEEVLPAAAAALARGEPAALVTIVRSSGSTPQRTRAKKLVFADRALVGTTGGGCYDKGAVGRARDALACGQQALLTHDVR